MKYQVLISLSFVTMILAGCGDDVVPQSIVDQNQIISRENAEKNALLYKSNRFPNASQVLIDSDSSITADCRFGDGWASGKIIKQDGSSVDIKCQTTGHGKGYNGCLLKSEFVKKSYANEEGSCNDALTELPKFK